MKQRSQSSNLNSTINKVTPLEVRQNSTLILKNASIYLNEANEIKGIFNTIKCTSQANKKKVSSSVNDDLLLQDSPPSDTRTIFKKKIIKTSNTIFPKKDHKDFCFSTAIDFFKQQKTIRHPLSPKSYLKELSLKKPIEKLPLKQLQYLKEKRSETAKTINYPKKDLKYYKNYFSRTDQMIDNTSLVDTLSITKMNTSEIIHIKKISMSARKTTARNIKRHNISRRLFFQKSISQAKIESFKEHSITSHFPQSNSNNNIHVDKKGITLINSLFMNDSITHQNDNNNRSQINHKNTKQQEPKIIKFKKKNVAQIKVKIVPSVTYRIRKNDFLSQKFTFIPKDIKDNYDINLPYLIDICSFNQSKNKQNLLNH